MDNTCDVISSLLSHLRNPAPTAPFRPPELYNVDQQSGAARPRDRTGAGKIYLNKNRNVKVLHFH